jgi:PAS domain S-box-containing protein
VIRVITHWAGGTMGLGLPNRSLIEPTEQGLWLIDAEGRTLFANARLLQILGMTVSEMGRKRIFDFLAANQIELVREKLSRVFDGARETFALPFLGSAGKEVLCRVLITPADDARALAALTELGPLEKELLEIGRAQGRRESERLEEINRQKDEFLGTLSHELRTPLHVILGWSRQMRKMNLPPQAAHAAEIIERNATLQAQMMDDLLDISRIISGKLKMDLRKTDLAQAIRGVLEVIEPTAQAKQVQLRAELPPDAAIWGDPQRLQQVFWNLISNGVKFTPPGGSVSIQLQRTDGHIEIKVSDTGEGIDPELLPCLFERFRQGDGSTTRKHGGIGLGLTLVRHLVELHGGKVHAESAGKNQGSAFVVTLPSAAEPAATAST